MCQELEARTYLDTGRLRTDKSAIKRSRVQRSPDPRPAAPLRTRFKTTLVVLLVVPLLLLSFFSSGAAVAAVYYVSTSGSDSNSGSISSAWKTIQKAANSVSAGDTVMVNAGTYTERVTVSRSGSSSAYITIKANGTVDMKGFTLTGSYVRVSGFRIDQPSWNGFYISGNSNIVEYNEVSRSIYNGDDADGIRFFGDGHIIRYNYIHDIRQDDIPDAHTDCFQTYDNSAPPSTNILIEGNYCYNPGHQMMMLSAVTQFKSSNLTIRNNVFEYNNPVAGWQGIYLWDIPNSTVVHNTFINGRYRGVLTDGSPNTIVKNNIFYNVPLPYDGAGIDASNNVIYRDTYSVSSSSNNVLADPQFVDLAGKDYHLKSTSPAIDKGVNLGVTTDKDGNPRPVGRGPDIGAYEFSSSSSAPAAPTALRTIP